MLNQDLQVTLRKYVEIIATLPEEQRQPLMTLVEETQRRQEVILRVQREAMDTLDDLRIAEKYRVFDLECREREAKDQAEIGDEFDPEF